jgi:hypothetical protein
MLSRCTAPERKVSRLEGWLYNGSRIVVDRDRRRTPEPRVRYTGPLGRTILRSGQLIASCYPRPICLRLVSRHLGTQYRPAASAAQHVRYAVAYRIPYTVYRSAVWATYTDSELLPTLEVGRAQRVESTTVPNYRYRTVGTEMCTSG